jgi:outer membrane protein assembly factor BamB
MKMGRNGRGLFLLVFFVRLLSSAKAADWPYYQHDPQHTGASPAHVDPAKLSLAWSAPEGYSTPLIVGDTIYSTHNQGGFTGGDSATLISAFDLATGAIKWTYSGSFVFPSQAAVGGGLVVFHTGMYTAEAGQLYVLDATTGTLRYIVPGLSTDLTFMPLLVPNPADGTVMAYCGDPYSVRAVQLGQTGGSVLWTAYLNAPAWANVALVGDSMPMKVPRLILIRVQKIIFTMLASAAVRT